MEYFPEVQGGEDDDIDFEKTDTEDQAENIDIDKMNELSQDNVFVQKPIKIKQVVEEDKPKPKKERKKRIMTEEHKQKLAEARVKALEVRRENSRIKNEEKELLKMKKKQDLDKLRNEVHGKPVEMKIEEVVQPKPIIQKVVEKPVEKLYSKKELDSAVLQGIAGYDSLRKSRKKEKTIKDEQQQNEARIKAEIIRKCSANPIIDDDPFSHCY